MPEVKSSNKYPLSALLLNFTKLMGYDAISSIINKRDQRFISDLVYYIMFQYLNRHTQNNRDVPNVVYTRAHNFISKELNQKEYDFFYTMFATELGLDRIKTIDHISLYNDVFAPIFDDEDIAKSIIKLYIAQQQMYLSYGQITDVILDDFYREAYNGLSHLITACFLNVRVKRLEAMKRCIEEAGQLNRDIEHNVRCGISHINRGYKDVAKVIIMRSLDYIKIQAETRSEHSSIYSSFKKRYVDIRKNEICNISTTIKRSQVTNDIFNFARDIVVQQQNDSEFRKTYLDNCRSFIIEQTQNK